MPVKKGLPATKKMRHDRHYVEDLLRREGDLMIQTIPLAKIHPNPDQPRKDMGDLSGLAASIEEHGILEPILVKQIPAGYQIISGERRFQAAHLAELTELPCIVKDLESSQILEVALVENLQRKDLHPFEEADGLAGLQDHFGYTHDHIAKKIGKSRSSVTETLTLATLSAQVRQAALHADINAKSMLLSVSRLPTVEEQLTMIERISKGANREEVRRQSKRQKKAKPFVFKYVDPSKSFSFNLRFKKAEVEPRELIHVLETVLDDLKSQT